MKDGKTDPCQAKADAQKLALMLDQQYQYDDGLKFRVDTSLMANDDPCKATLKSACGGKTQCSVISIFNSWPSNCQPPRRLASAWVPTNLDAREKISLQTSAVLVKRYQHNERSHLNSPNF